MLRQIAPTKPFLDPESKANPESLRIKTCRLPLHITLTRVMMCICNPSYSFAVIHWYVLNPPWMQIAFFKFLFLFSACPRTMTFQYCSDCMHSCTDKLHRRSCSDNCTPGCNCPPNTFWNNVECVPIEMCPSTDNNLPDSNSKSENINLNEQSRVDMKVTSTMVQTTVETLTRPNRSSTGMSNPA